MPACLDPTKWRQHPYDWKGYLWLDKPPAVFQCQVNGAVTYPVADIPYRNVTIGAYTDCWQHQLVLFGSTPGADDLGRGRLRKVPTSSTLYIGRSSQGIKDGTCNISDGSWITVVDSFLPFSRIPFDADGITNVNGTFPPITTQFRDWDFDYTFGIEGYPQVNLGGGPGFAKYVDPNTNLLTLSLNPVLYSKGYDSNITDYHWYVADGTIQPPGTPTSPQVTITFPPGRRYIHVVGTQANGNSTTRHLLVVSCKDGTAYEPIKYFATSGHKLDLDGNKNAFNVRVFQDIPRSTYPDKMMAIYFEDEDYAGDAGPLNVIGATGQTGFEHIQFCGWHFSDQNNTDAQPTGTISEVTLNCLDMAGWLDKLPGFPIEINRMTTPTNWYQMKSANMDAYFKKGILDWMSTAPYITDYYDSNTGDEYAFARLGSGQKTLYQQIQELADRGIGYEFSCNEQGMLYIRPDQCLLEPGARTNINIIELTEDDISNIHFLFQRHPKTHWNRGAFVLVSTVDVTAIDVPQTTFWVSPGPSPAQGPDAVDANEQLAQSAQEAKDRTSGRDAEDNNDYGDLEVTLIHTGNCGIDPAYGQWVYLNVSDEYLAQRGISLSNKRLRVMSVTIDREATPTGNSKTIRFIGRPETVGVTATEEIQPTDPNPPTDTQPTTNPVPADAGNAWGSADNFIPDGWIVGEDTGYIGLISQATASLSVREIFPAGVIGHPGTVALARLIQDPYNYKRLIALYNVPGTILSCADYTQPTLGWSDLNVNPPSGWSWYWDIKGSINRQNYFAWVGYNNSTAALRYYYTTDNFATINHSDIPDTYPGNPLAAPSGKYGWAGAAGMACIHINSFNTSSNGVVYFQTAWGKTWKSTDWGATWTLAFTNIFSAGLPTYMNIPFSLVGGAKNTTPTLIFRDDNNNTNPNFGMTSKIWNSPSYNFIYNPEIRWVSSNLAMNSFTLDGNYAIIVFSDGHANTGPYFVRTTTGGASWTEMPFTNRGGPFWGINGWPTNKNFYVSFSDAHIIYSTDGANSWTDVSSAYISATNGAGQAHNLYNLPYSLFQVIPDLNARYPVGGIHPS